MPSSIAETFRRLVRDGPERPAVHDAAAGRTLTRQQLADDARVLAKALAGALPARPCLVASVGNCSSLLAMLLAALELETAVLLLDGDAGLEHTLAVAARFGADSAIVRADAAVGHAAAHHALPFGLAGIATPLAAGRDWRGAIADGPVVLKMTSGSSRRPRAVIVGESQLEHDAAQIAEAMDIGPSDVNFAALPLAHSYGFGNLVLPLFLQGSALVLRQRFLPREIARDVSRYRVTTFPGAPPLFEHLRRHDLAQAVAGIRLLVTAGAPISPDTVQYFKAAVGRKIHSFYGSSETGGITFDDSDDITTPPTVGRPMPGTSVELRDRAAASEVGRVFVRGPAVASGYAAPYDDAGDQPFVDGGFLTADVGRFTRDGQLILAGRVSTFINVAGRKVDPAEVEGVLMSIPGVAAATVIGIPCAARGEQVVAHVHVETTSLTETEVRRYCSARLQPHQVPRHIVLGDEYLSDARGKFDRGRLQQMIAARLESVAVNARGAELEPVRRQE